MADSTDKRLFDVAKPGKSLPEPTSRPVIVSNRPIVKDPTLKHPETGDDAEVSSQKEDSIVSPVSNEGKNVEPSEEAKNEAKEVSTKEPAPTETESTDSETSIEEQNLEPMLADKKKQNAAEDAEKARQAEIDKLVADGTYALPIGKSKRHRNTTKFLLITIVILLIGIVTADLLVDAGIIKTNISPPVDLIKN